MKPIKRTTIIAGFFRIWMNVKALFKSKDPKTILNSHKYGGSLTETAYNKVQQKDKHEDFTPEQTMINQQYTLLKALHAKVKDLRDMLIKKE